MPTALTSLQRAPALHAARPHRGRVLRRAAAPCRAQARGDEGQHPKRSIEEITAGQASAAEPGGSLGRLDPGPRAGGATAPPAELDIDPELRAAVLPLLRSTRRSLMASHGSRAGPSHALEPHAVAAAAVAAAEASGALPPLAGQQREALEGFFARLAAEGLEGPGGDEGFEKFGSSGGEALYGEEDAVLRVRPMQLEVLEAAINAHLASGGAPHRSSGPSDSAKAGGEVGNLALQSDVHGSEEPRGVPAESLSDRAERRANAEYMELEMADLPRERAPDPASQQQWQAHRAAHASAAHAAVEGDAPAAGDGLQAMDAPAERRQVGGAGEPFAKDQCSTGEAPSE